MNAQRSSTMECSLFNVHSATKKKKEWNNAICNNMDGPRDYHSKWGKSDKNITYLWNLKKKKENDTNELTYKTETD